MSYLKLQFPILVSQFEIDGKSQYRLRPLFFSFPTVNAGRFEKALNRMKTEIRRSFKGFDLERSNMDDLFWYMFNPKVNFKVYDLEFVAGKHYVKGKFGAAFFVIKKNCFVILPDFNYYLFIASYDEKGKLNIQEEITEVIREMIRSGKKKRGDDFEVDDFLTHKSAFVTSISMSVNIRYAKFSFEEDPLESFFARMGGSFDFVGEVEIEKVGKNLNEDFPTELMRAFYADEDVQRLGDILYGADNTPIVLVGNEGVGKRSLIHETVYRYCKAHKETREELRERVWHIDPTRIISGMSIVGMWQKRFEAILRFVMERRKKFDNKTDKILIDNVVAMIRIGKSAQNDMTLADVLKPFLEKRQIQLILSASPEEWKILQEKDRRFADLFQVIRKEEPDPETALKMVIEQRKRLELDNSCIISTLAVLQLFSIQRNYLRRKALPGSVMKLLKQLAVKYKGGNIDTEEVRIEFEHFSGLHQEIFDNSYTFKVDEVRHAIEARLVGQPEASEALANVIHLVKSKLNNPYKPLSSFLFIGPTGVGKTQAAKVLSAYLMGSEAEMLRFDMNEYIDDYAVQRLIGDYQNPEGLLTGAVRYRPFGVLLFDEIEKANPKVHDLLLQVLDDGRLTDSLGRTVDFTNIIIIMTSNVGARDASATLGYSKSEADEQAVYRKAVERHFRPEFVNRIEKIVIFKSLQLEHILGIAHLQIRELLSRDGFVRRTTILNISSDALEWVARRGFDAKMGGRALKRQIERDLTTLSAQQLIKTYSERPIIFDIVLKDNKLSPRITTLEFIEALDEGWLPSIPNEKQGRKFYGKLIREIENLEEEVELAEEEINQSNGSSYIDTSKPEVLNWHYYWFKDKLIEYKETIRRKILGFGHDILDEAPVIPLRLKRVKGSLVVSNLASGKERKIMRDRLFQEEGLAEIRDMYRFEQAFFDKMQSSFLNDVLDFEFLDLFSDGFLENTVDKLEIQIHSAINNQGEEEIEFLCDLLTGLLKSMEIQHSRERRSSVINVEGHSMLKFFSGEAGFHFFHRAHKSPLPVQVRILDKKTGDLIEDQRIIRIYDGKDAITDLRTGFTIEGALTANEFKLLIFGGISSQRSANLK